MNVDMHVLRNHFVEDHANRTDMVLDVMTEFLDQFPVANREIGFFDWCGVPIGRPVSVFFFVVSHLTVVSVPSRTSSGKTW
jgi:hypothetical protein